LFRAFVIEDEQIQTKYERQIGMLLHAHPRISFHHRGHGGAQRGI